MPGLETGGGGGDGGGIGDGVAAMLPQLAAEPRLLLRLLPNHPATLLGTCEETMHMWKRCATAAAYNGEPHVASKHLSCDNLLRRKNSGRACNHQP